MIVNLKTGHPLWLYDISEVELKRTYAIPRPNDVRETRMRPSSSTKSGLIHCLLSIDSRSRATVYSGLDARSKPVSILILLVVRIKLLSVWYRYVGLCCQSVGISTVGSVNMLAYVHTSSVEIHVLITALTIGEWPFVIIGDRLCSSPT